MEIIENYIDTDDIFYNKDNHGFGELTQDNIVEYTKKNGFGELDIENLIKNNVNLKCKLNINGISLDDCIYTCRNYSPDSNNLLISLGNEDECYEEIDPKEALKIVKEYHNLVNSIYVLQNLLKENKLNKTKITVNIK